MESRHMGINDTYLLNKMYDNNNTLIVRSATYL